MPDMDGIQATALITESVPTAAVIMMSVQNDPDYMRRAMLAGARNFLTKPIKMDELYSTIRKVHDFHKKAMPVAPEPGTAKPTTSTRTPGNRAGHVVVVYSPQGGVGATTIATNLASGLMKEGVRVLLIDADLQFGDVGIMLNLQSQSTMVDLIRDVDDLDTELFENIVATHDSGLKVLLGPSRPEFYESVEEKPEALAQIIKKVSPHYDFIVVDTSTRLDEVLLNILDMSRLIVLVCMPTIPSVKNSRLALDLFDQLKYPHDKIMLAVNRVPDDRQAKRSAVSLEKITDFLKHEITTAIPSNEMVVNRAINKAVPVIATDRDKSKSPIKELLELAEAVHDTLEKEQATAEEEPEVEAKVRRTGLGFRLGR